MQSVNTVDTNQTGKVKSIFCFVITPAMQRKGVATQLLERVCKDVLEDGFDYIEAYSKKDFVRVARDFMGPAEMYKKLGFTIYNELDNGEIVMRKQLK